MKKFEFKYLLNYWFLGALALLLINDFILKEAFHNVFTGKLSDFAGLFFLPLFLAAFFPKRIKEILLSTAIFFIYWKSPLSAGLINFVNSLSTYHFNRVIDYSDLLALSILPLSYYIYNTIDSRQQVQIHPLIPILVGSFALFATSQEREHVDIQESYLIEKDYTQILQEIDDDSLLLSNNQVYISFYPNTTQDTSDFYLQISGVQMNKSATVYGYLYEVDSLSSIFYFESFEQNGDCGFMRPRCRENYDSKTIVLESLENQFISFF